jgi:hypothetical protein
MASQDLEEEQATHFIAPRSWSGRVYFSAAAIRAALQSNPPHNKTLTPLSKQKNVAQLARETKGCATKTKQPYYWERILQVAADPKMFGRIVLGSHDYIAQRCSVAMLFTCEQHTNQAMKHRAGKHLCCWLPAQGGSNDPARKKFGETPLRVPAWAWGSLSFDTLF